MPISSHDITTFPSVDGILIPADIIRSVVNAHDHMLVHVIMLEDDSLPVS